MFKVVNVKDHNYRLLFNRINTGALLQVDQIDCIINLVVVYASDKLAGSSS